MALDRSNGSVCVAVCLSVAWIERSMKQKRSAAAVLSVCAHRFLPAQLTLSRVIPNGILRRETGSISSKFGDISHFFVAQPCFKTNTRRFVATAIGKWKSIFKTLTLTELHGHSILCIYDREYMRNIILNPCNRGIRPLLSTTCTIQVMGTAAVWWACCHNISI